MDVLRLGCHCRPAVTTSLGVEVVFRGEDEEQDGNGIRVCLVREMKIFEYHIGCFEMSEGVFGY